MNAPMTSSATPQCTYRIAITSIVAVVVTLCVHVKLAEAQSPVAPTRVDLKGDLDATIQELRAKIKALADSGLANLKPEQLERLNELTGKLRKSECTVMLDSAGRIGLDTQKSSCLWGNGGHFGLDLANVTTKTDGASIYADLLTTTFGIARASVGSMISRANEGEDADGEHSELRQEALQRLLAGGGNLVLGFQAPLRVDFPGSYRAFSLFLLSGRAAFDFSGMSSDVQSGTNYNTAATAQWQGNWRSDDDALALFGQLKAEVLGGSPQFRQPLGIDKDAATLSQFAIGVVVRQSITATYTRVFYSSDSSLLGLGGQFSITATRGF
jgi:hypothetical protein